MLWVKQVAFVLVCCTVFPSSGQWPDTSMYDTCLHPGCVSKNPGCARRIKVKEPGTMSVSGSDSAGDGASCDGATDVSWGPLAASVDRTTIIVDFSPKGGPKEAKGTFNASVGVIWEDGHVWHLLRAVSAQGVHYLTGDSESTLLEVQRQVYFEPDDCTSDLALVARKGDKLSVHYVGTIDSSSTSGEPGMQFDSSRGPGRTPFKLTLGKGSVIAGWEEGLLGMCKGSKAILVIPPALGYGDAGTSRRRVKGVIPGGATLRFDVEIVHIERETNNHDSSIKARTDATALTASSSSKELPNATAPPTTQPTASTILSTQIQRAVRFEPPGCRGVSASTAQNGDVVTVDYIGTIDASSAAGQPNKLFDSSKRPFSFTLGEGHVIAGWDQGLLGMCKGSKLTLVILPELGYGATGAGRLIPGGATLNFEIEVVDIAHGSSTQGI